MSVNYVDKSTGDLIRVAGGGNDILYADSPIGSIIPYGGTTAPDGFLLCQGQAISRTTYAELFAVIGTSFGSGDGSTTFNVPDLRGEFLRGAGTNSHSGQGNGGIVGQHQDATTVPYFGSFLYGDNVVVEPGVARDMTRQYVSNYDKVIEASSTYYGIIGSQKVESGTLTTAGTVRPTNTSVNYIIKAKQVDAPADFMDAVAEALAVIDSPITKVGTTINGDRFWSKRTGNVVEIMIDGTTGSNIPCAQSVVVAKVPKNALTISDVCIEIDSKSLVSAPESGHKRAWVDSTGNVCVFIVMPDLAATYTGNIYIGGTYITAE